MTLSALQTFGIGFERSDENTIVIRGGQRYCPQRAKVEGDYSNAAFFQALDMLGGDVQVGNLDADSLQVLRLRFPVDPPTHKVIPSQRHPLCTSASLREIPITQQPLHITEIVLRQRHQQNASVLKRLQLTLELDPRTNALYPILTDNTVSDRYLGVMHICSAYQLTLRSCL